MAARECEEQQEQQAHNTCMSVSQLFVILLLPTAPLASTCYTTPELQ